ncbi:MAG: hypothetical protein COX82_03620 [Candidatus Magasanikbacteria bacterium CG_4_10_14_0_2_um_filter_41_10]|uniref:Glycosyltransferase 2-like domain-containing protein n=1 Tax=Candidatus Magasanikbacteria bacterium CG_4_10_14_0_2_um_filter_41_10 TaxID=1974638 RepID=A0A2M7V371_9BACT|nr:MAG: hypothetical protein COX82_03620 [Candidatus Magasanikbacteria bacterium CG_4_10_14_0_2_um_filter_41_10]
MKNNNITFVLFTLNEEKRVSYAIRNLISYGDVMIMDAGSTDNTKNIAERLGARFFLRPPSDNLQVETQQNFEFIKKNITTDWVYWGFVDNLVPKSLLEKVVNVIQEEKYIYIFVPLFSYLYGMTDVPMLKSFNPMFFRKDAIDFTDNVMHGMGKFLGKKNQILKLPSSKKYAVRHFSLYDVNKFVRNHLGYANEEAVGKFARGKKFAVWLMLGAMIRYFILYYKYSFRNGAKGLMTALLYAQFRLLVYVKLYEIEHNINLDTIEASFVEAKEKILKEFE